MMRWHGTTRPPSSLRTPGQIIAVLAALVLAGCANGTSHPRANTNSTAPASHAHGSPPPAAPLRAGERFVNLSMPQAYTPSAPNGGTDEYRCFLVDPGLTTPASLTGSQFLPDNADLVHHAIFFRISPAEVEAARTLDANAAGQGWTCFAGTGVGSNLRSGGWVGAWAPGSKETLLDPDVGYPMPAGSQLVMQVHYNLLSTAGRPGGSDRSGVRLRISDASLRPLQTTLLPAPIELPCTEDQSGPLCDRGAAVADVTHRFGAEVGGISALLNQVCNKGQPPVPANTQHCDIPVTEAGMVYALGGHMHLLGRKIAVELNPGTSGARTLLDIGTYNFDDQSLRPLAQPVAVSPGDTLRVTCTHDAALRKVLPQLQSLPPRYVVWGDGTSDEMCLGLVVWTAAKS